VCQIFKFLATKPWIINPLFFPENALKLSYGNEEFRNFPRASARPRFTGGKGSGGKSGREKRGEERRERVWGIRNGKGGKEGLKEREGMERGEGREEGERNLDLRCSRRIDATAANVGDMNMYELHIAPY
jgi:hypothetical protein